GVAEECERLGMEFLSTPFSVAAVDRLVSLGVKGFKVGSGEVSNPFILRRIAETGLPVILSTGMHSDREIANAVEILRTGGSQVALLHCVSVYPAPHELMAIRSIPALMERFPETPIGISDHSEGIWTALGAVALGACVVEKHFTADRQWPGPDMPVSIEPKELSDLIEGATAIWRSLQTGSGDQASEAPVRSFAISSIVTAVEIPSGSVISESDLALKRPGTGDFHAEDLPTVIGARTARTIPPNEFLRTEDLHN
ncbi:MAG TPA: polyhydroxyalkanoate biosynthesis repressor PhaR, partial [Actinobacteria bacterium]|nr:polyhydroxyalkanoate biosynthesis repressor PhaR [Actinomycetota bacterium]